MADNFDELFPTKPKRERKKKTESINETVEKITTIADSPNHQKTTGWSNEDIETITMGAALLFAELTKFVSYRLVETDELAMNEDEIEVISKAVSRIFLRHIKVAKGKRGDVTDGMMLIVALSAYSLRTIDGYKRIKRKANETNHPTGNTKRNNQTIPNIQPGIQAIN